MRNVAWASVIAAGLSLVAITCALFSVVGTDEVLALGFGAVAFAVLALREK